MSAASYPLRKIQFGVESTPGTGVAATNRLVGEGVYTPEVDRYYSSYPRGVRANVTGGGIDTRKGSALSFSSELDFEQVMLILGTGLVVPVTTGSGPYTHTYSPDASTAPDVEAATFEFVIDDGTTKHYERAFHFGTARRLSVSLGYNEVARMSADIFGRAEQSEAMTASLGELARTPIPSNLFTASIDDTWANLGVTPKSFVIRAASLDLNFGVAPDYCLDGRSDLDFTHLTGGSITGSLSLTLEHNADAATEVGHWRSRTARFIRLEASSGTKSLRFDMAGFYNAVPRFSHAGDVETVTLSYGLEYDATGAHVLAARIVNGLSGI